VLVLVCASILDAIPVNFSCVFIWIALTWLQYAIPCKFARASASGVLSYVI
jgi:hypothetical protein